MNKDSLLPTTELLQPTNRASKLYEIATKNGLDSNKYAKIYSALIVLGIIKKDKPLTEDEGQKSISLLYDQMLRFWYRRFE